MYALIKENGIRGFRELTANFGANRWYRENKKIQGLNFEQSVDPFGKLKEALNAFEKIELEAYRDKVYH